MSTLFFEVKAKYDELNALISKVNELETKLRSLDLNVTPKADVTKLENELKVVREQMDAIYKSAALAGKAVTSMGGMNISNGFGNASSGMRAVTSGLTSAARGASDLRDRMNEVGTSTNGVASGVAAFTRQFTAAALVLKGITSIISTIKGAVSTIQSFEAANMTLAAITGSTTDELKALTQSALDLGRTTVFTASQVTQLQTELAKLGFSQNDILAMESSVLGFAQATGTDLASAASTAGAALRMFGADTQETERYVGAMAAATRLSALNFQAVSDNLATFGPVAKSVGMSVEDSLAIFAKLKDAGYEGSTAATSVRNILNEMVGGKLQKEIGMQVNNIETFVEALKKLQAAGYGGSEGVAKAMKGVGKRGGAQLLTLITQADTLVELSQKIKEGEDGLAQMGDTMNNNVAGAMKMMQSAWEGFILAFSESTGPMKGTIDFVTESITKLTNFITNDTSMIDFDSAPIERAVTALEMLIGTLSAYYVIKKTGSAIDNLDIKNYEKQAVAMQKLQLIKAENMSTEMMQAVSKGRLTAQQALTIESLRVEAREELRVIQAKYAEAEANLACAVSMQGVGTAREQQIAKELLEEAQLQRNILLKQRDAAANVVDATSKSINAGATTKLKDAMVMLGVEQAKALVTNPYILMAAAVGTLIALTVSYATHTDNSVKAHENMVNIMKRENEMMDEHRNKVNSLVAAIKDENKTNYERYNAWKQLASLRGFEGISYTDALTMGDGDLSTKTNAYVEEQMKSVREQRQKIYSELAKSGDYSISEKLLNDTLDKFGVVDEKIRKEYMDELKSISTWESDARYYVEQSKNYRDEIANVNKDMAESNIFNSLSKLGNKSSKAIEAVGTHVKSLMSELSKFSKTELEITKTKDVFSMIGNSIDHVDSKIKVLNYEISKAEGDKKAELQLQLDYAQNERDVLEQLLKASESGALTRDMIVRITSETNGDGIELSTTTANKLSEAYSLAEVSMDKFNETQMLLNDSLKDGNTSAEEYSKTLKDSSKALMTDVESASKKANDAVEELKKKLDDPKLTDNQKKRITIDLENAEKAKKDIDGLLQALKDATSEQQTIDVVVNYVEKANTNYAAPWMPTWGKNSANVRAHASAKPQEEEKDDDKSTDKASSINAAADARKREKQYQEVLKENAKKRKELSEKLETETTDAVIEASDKGFDKIVKQREQQNKKELDKIRKDGEERVKEFIALKKREWEADPSHQEVRAKDADKNGEGGQAYKAAVDFNEDEYKKSEEFIEFQKKNEELMASQRIANARKYVDEIVSGYETFSSKRKDENDKYLADIAALEKAIAENSENDDVIDALNERIRLVKVLQQESLVNDDYEAYIEKYGSYVDRKRLIDEKYNREKAKLEAEGNFVGVATATAKRDSDLQALEFSKIKEELNWEGLFDDLGKYSTTALKEIRDKLKTIIDENDLSVEDRRTVGEKITSVNEAIDSRSFLGAILPSLAEINRDKANASIADANLDVAEKNKEIADKEVSMLQDAILSALEGMDLRGVGIDMNNVTFEDKGKAIDLLKDAGLDENSKEVKALGESFDKLGASQAKASKAAKELSAAESKAKDAHDKTEMSLRKAADNWSKFLSDIGGQLSQVGDLIDVLGAGDTGIGKAAKNVADGVGQAAGAFGDFASGNYVGAVVKGIGALKSFGRAFGIGSGNAAEVAKITERNTKANEYLTKAVEKLTDEMRSAKGAMSVLSKYKDALEQQKDVTKNTQEILRAQSGYNAAHHSNTYYLNEELSNTDWNSISKVVGQRVANADQLLGLTPEQMGKLRENAALWQKVLETGKYDKSEYWNAYADLAGKELEIEELMRESLTGTTFDGMYSDFVSKIADMSKTAKDFSGDFSKMMYDSLLNSKIGDAFSGDLEKFYQEWADRLKDGDLTHSEIDAMQEQYQGIVDQALKLRETVKSVTGYTGDDKYSQQGSAGGFQTMSQDKGEEMNGRLTAIQIAVEAIRGILERSGVDYDTINGVISSIGEIGEVDIDVPTDGTRAIENVMADISKSLYALNDITSIKSISDEIRTILANSYLELVAINRNTESVIKPIRQMSLDIADMKENIKKSL